jgi:hypothetical protein
LAAPIPEPSLIYDVPMSQAKVFAIGFACGLFLGLLIGLVFWELT